MGHSGIRPGDNVSLLRNISRDEDLSYGIAGQSGQVIEVFKNKDDNWDLQRQREKQKTLYVKVKMDLPGKPIRTFRLTSLARK